MPTEKMMRVPVAERLFPAHTPREPVYLERQASGRYQLGGGAFIVFLAFFVFYAVRYAFEGLLTAPQGLFALAGAATALLFLLIYAVRFLRSGYAISAEGVHIKSGFFMGREYLIPFAEIAAVDVPHAESPLTRAQGSLKLTLASGVTRHLGDVREPLRFARLLALRLPR
jgi:membrane protein YdbS with pleckstrin-like domain